MSAQGLWVNTPLMVLALGAGLVLHHAGRRPRGTRGGSASPLVPRQAACAERSARACARRSELTDMIDASEPETCPACGWALERGYECDASECARLLASSY
jgi:hypothetical protein